jgi:hypothetical protein
MNEVEITLWVLNIAAANISWENCDFDQALTFLIAGLQAKVFGV